MPKKDTASAVLGMLSTAGAQTRPPMAPLPPEPVVNAEPEVAPAPTAAAPETAAPTPAPAPAAAASVSRLPGALPQQSAKDAAPRTLRLRPDTASRLRAAWLEAKRDDVLLTAQDFASELVEEALVRHGRRRAASSS